MAMIAHNVGQVIDGRKVEEEAAEEFIETVRVQVLRGHWGRQLTATIR
jgi:glutamine amidotransferase PdxT